MKNLILSIVLASMLSQPAQAGVVHRLGKIVAAPAWIFGFTACVVADVTIVPIVHAVRQYTSTPCVSW